MDLVDKYRLEKEVTLRQWRFIPKKGINEDEAIVRFNEADNEMDAWVVLFINKMNK